MFSSIESVGLLEFSIQIFIWTNSGNLLMPICTINKD